MKELHHHIFSNTACISKESMLKYINKQLTEKELHNVQKHLLDCELCSEAIEGLKYAQNSSMLFTIDHQIDQIATQKNTPIIKTIMIAASVLVIIFGSYFTYISFNNAVENSSTNMSINTVNEKRNEADMEIPSAAPEVIEELNAAEETNSIMETIIQQDEKVNDKAPLLVEIIEEDAEAEEEIDASGFIENQKNEGVATSFFSTNDEFNNNKNDDNLADAENRKDALTQTITKEQTIESTNTSTIEDANYNRNIVSGNIATKAATSFDKKDKAKKEATKPRESNIEPSLNKVAESDDASLGGFADRFEQPNEEAEKKVEHLTWTESEAVEESEADFKTGADKSKEVAPTLNNAIKLYENKQYSKALSELEEIPQNTHEDENKIRWYKALCLIELNQPEMAKPLLNTIIKNNKTFVKEAKEKLVEIE